MTTKRELISSKMCTEYRRSLPNINRSAFMTRIVLKLCLSQSCFGDWRPIDRHVTLEDEAFFIHFKESDKFVLDIFFAHRNVRIAPVANDSPGLEFFSLGFDCFLSKCSGFLANFDRLFLVTLFRRGSHLELNGKAVAVPAWTIKYAEAWKIRLTCL